MKRFKFTTILLPAFIFFIGSITFSQVNLPISGIYRAPAGADFDRLEATDQKITTYKGTSIVGTFFAIEKANDIYILEVARPGTPSFDPDPERDKKLMKVRVSYLDEKECRLSVTWPDGTKQELTLSK